jgi:mono/diheme cytochrome c family protein
MKRFWLSLAAIVAVGLVAVAIFLFIPEPQESLPPRPADALTGEAQIRHGEYLARAADCAACHTRPGQPELTGGLPFVLPFGTIYTPNITPDKETGIGNWSDADFVRALHHGVDNKGRTLYPAFPYASYALMSTEDALAIKAYLFSLAPVRAEPPKNDVAFPFNQRYLVRFWRLLFVPGHRFEPDKSKTPDWNRGAYLVDVMGHCGECHTPRNLAYGLKNSEKFAGAEFAGQKAYNITQDKEHGIGGWSDQAMADYLSTGHGQGHGAASGGMADAVQHSLRYLTPADIGAMVTYLRTIEPRRSDDPVIVDHDPPAPKISGAYAPKGDAGTVAMGSGQRIFEGACASCHAWTGQGQQTPYAALLGSRSVNDTAGTNVVDTILHGTRIATASGEVFMPSFGHGYDDNDIAAVANYVVEHFGGKTGTVKPGDVAKARLAGGHDED